jgi:hypothetical protein
MLNSWLPSASGDIRRARAALRLTGASAIHVRGMDKLTVDAVREIEQIHSSWIEFEVAGEDHSLMALCADDIELWPLLRLGRHTHPAPGPRKHASRITPDRVWYFAANR